MNINQSQELFHHGQHSNRYFTGPKRIDIYRFPIRRHKKYKKEKSNRISLKMNYHFQIKVKQIHQEGVLYLFIKEEQEDIIQRLEEIIICQILF